MNRRELGKELDVSACNVDDWLLLGCPYRRSMVQIHYRLPVITRG
jgi:hypothetical protein